ncbi:alpha-taxilin-like [Pollicipes pollicipes]|uniref:alpha-taxilin-like n=1 Tax=Pollicipes pollicipes TaxID=41117 RepID=UPI001885027A|nr:alpha-taxilin-like [Pollicipes pollicipes]
MLVKQRLVDVCRGHAEQVEDNKRLQSSVRKLKHRLDQLLRETSGLEVEQARVLLTRSQLEALCRELQTQNRAIKEESQAKVREESERRRAVAAQFQTTLNDISSLIADSSEKNAKLTDENASISGKLAKLCQQYEQKNAAATTCQARCKQLEATEAQLKAQLDACAQRFDDVQAALAQSNTAFDTYKTDIDKVGLWAMH